VWAIFSFLRTSCKTSDFSIEAVPIRIGCPVLDNFLIISITAANFSSSVL
jgi:hypothetical protein